MSQMRWFHKLSSIILIILAHYWDFELKRRVCVAHHCISDDLNKSNEQMTHCFDFVRYTFLCTSFVHIFATLCIFIILHTSLSETFMIKKMAGPCLLNQETSICTLSLIMRETSARMYTSSVGW